MLQSRPEATYGSEHEDKSLLTALLGDGRPLLIFFGLSLILSGGFALFLSINQQFLPHDVQFLGMTVDQLCAINNCRVVHFMFHDRVAFGGALISIGALYMWLAEFPLRRGEAWAWWLFIVSGISGFGSFLAYLGYGYLDTWHGIGTVLMVPFFIIGLARSRLLLKPPAGVRSVLRPGVNVLWRSSFGIGRALLLATAAGMILGGLTVMAVGMTRVFVPQDLEFIGLQPSELRAISSRLVPLIAHDRAGFGGAICTTGIMVFFCVWCARPSRSLWQVLCFSGLVGFAAAIGVHPVVGYTNLFHLAPAILGAVIFVLGLVLCYPTMHQHNIKPQAREEL
jgi:MFS family permease